MVTREDNMVYCPYNKSHVISSQKLIRHVTKCKKDCLHIRMLICLYNNSHLVEKGNYNNHIAECPDAKTMVSVTYQIEDEEDIIIPGIQPDIPEIPNQERWDEGCDVESYDPDVHTADRNILKKLVSESKSKKKKFREAERRRLIEINAKDRELVTLSPKKSTNDDSKEAKSNVLSDDNFEFDKLSLTDNATPSISSVLKSNLD